MKPTITLETLIRSRVMPPSAMNRPVRMNSGTAIRVKVSMPVNIRCTITIIGTSLVTRIPPMVARPVQIAIGTLKTMRPIMMANTTNAIIKSNLSF